MALNFKDTQSLIAVSRLLGKMNLVDEVTEIAAMFDLDRETVKKYINGEASIPTDFKSQLYYAHLQLKAGIQPEKYTPDPKVESIPITRDIPPGHPVHQHIKDLHKEIRKQELEVMRQMDKVCELNSQLVKVASERIENHLKGSGKKEKKKRSLNPPEKDWLDNLEDRLKDDDSTKN